MRNTHLQKPLFNILPGWALLFFLALGSHCLAGDTVRVPGLLGFQGEKIGDDVHLEWSMEEAFMHYDFIVERSLDGEEFSAIGFVEAGGSLKGPQTYGFIDPNVVMHDSQILYYRLVEIGPKERNYPSQSIAISQLENHGIIVDFFPHPDKAGVTNIAYMAETRGELILQIVNAWGNSVFYSPLPTGKGFLVKEVSTARFPPGTYKIQVFDDQYAVEKEMEIREP